MKEAAEEALLRGRAAETAGEWQTALDAYDEALKHEPSEIGLWSVRGLALDRLGRTEEALESFRQSTSLKPNFPDYYNAGNMLLKLDMDMEAVRQFDLSIAENDSYAEAWVNRGIALTNLGELDEARDSFDTALSIKADFVPALRALAVLLHRVEDRSGYTQPRWRIARLVPTDAQAWYELGLAIAPAPDGELDLVEWEPGGRERQVVEMMDRALQADPSHLGAWAQKIHRLERVVEGIQAATRASYVAGARPPRDYELFAKAYVDAVKEGARTFPGEEWFQEALVRAEEVVGERISS